MKFGGGILLVIVGVAAALPLEINHLPLADEIPEEVRVKRKAQNHEISVGVSHGSSSGTSASIGYTYRFKRSLPEPQDVDPVMKENTRDTDNNENGNVRVRRDKNNEIDVHVSRGGGGGTQGTITYRRRFRRETPAEVAEDIDQTPLADGNVRVRRDKNNEIDVHVSRGGGGGTQGTITYRRRFRRETPAEVAEDIDQTPLADGNIRIRRDKNNEIDVHVSRGGGGGTQGTITYRRRFRRETPAEVAEDIDQTPLAGGNVRVRRDKNNEIDVHVSRGGGGGTQGTITYRRRFRRETPAEVAEDIDQTPLVDPIPDEVRVKREEKNHEISVGVSHGSSSGTSASIGYTYRFK